VNDINTYFTCNEIPSLGEPVIDVCPGEAILKIVTSGENSGYEWDFGDGSPKVITSGTVLQQKHHYALPGKYLVRLTSSNALANACSLNSSGNVSELTLNVVDSITPTISFVQFPSGNLCSGTKAMYIATITNGGLSPQYQWKINGINAGSNSPVFSTTTLENNDRVSCTLVSSFSCSFASISAAIIVKVDLPTVPTLAISTPTNSICSRVPVTFTAITTSWRECSYQWKVNGNNMGANSPTFSYAPFDQSKVTCELTVVNGCTITSKAYSDTIQMTVGRMDGQAEVKITSSQNNTCEGTNLVFTAIASNGGTLPQIQWILNGKNVGTNSFIYNNANLKSGDTLSCMMKSNSACVTNTTVYSEKIIIQPRVISTIVVSASAKNICSGDLVKFSAIATNTGTFPIYEWKLNGKSAGSNNSTFSSNKLSDKDTISCEFTSSLACATLVSSEPIVMQVAPVMVPSVTISTPSNSMCFGSTATFVASAGAGLPSPFYQWKVNGVNKGTNESSFSYSPGNGDIVTCVVTVNNNCNTTNSATSNTIKMLVPNDGIVASVSIAA
ncbi:MAG: PKD domain-containing protein, partial [Bacteroidota bacterium]